MSQGASISLQFPLLSSDKQTCTVFVLDTQPWISSSRAAVWRPDLQWPRMDCRGASFSLGDTGLSPATQSQQKHHSPGRTRSWGPSRTPPTSVPTPQSPSHQTPSPAALPDGFNRQRPLLHTPCSQGWVVNVCGYKAGDRGGWRLHVAPVPSPQLPAPVHFLTHQVREEGTLAPRGVHDRAEQEKRILGARSAG